MLISPKVRNCRMHEICTICANPTQGPNRDIYQNYHLYYLDLQNRGNGQHLYKKFEIFIIWKTAVYMKNAKHRYIHNMLNPQNL